MAAVEYVQPPVRVMIVDDSAVVRQVLADLLGRAADLQVIGVAADPIVAEQKMRTQWPDVLVLDLEMPRMDGLSFLRRIMAERPTPVLICSTLAEAGASVTVEALAAGAVGVVSKPRLGLKDFLQDHVHQLTQAVRNAAQSRPRAPLQRAQAVDHSMPALGVTTEKVVAIGTSTGGTQALEAILVGLPRRIPGMLVVQHMPERFTATFASRLNGLCAVEVKEAADADRVLPGRVLIAPGGRHMKLTRSGATYRVEVQDGPPINNHKPSVDVLFRSVAQHVGANALGILMTGMGDDGARGLLEMRGRGARTVAQDEASCVVFGMPREAIRLGAAAAVLPLDRIGSEILRIPL